MDEKINVYKIFVYNFEETSDMKVENELNIVKIPHFFMNDKYKEYLDSEIQSLINAVILNFSIEIQKMKYFLNRKKNNNLNNVCIKI